MQAKFWQLRQPDPKQVALLSSSLQIPNLVAGLLVNRGIDTAEGAKAFLSPRLGDLLDPFGIRDMDVAVQRILDALDSGERITIHGDYDVDGMTASAVLSRFFRMIGYDPHVFLPNRFRDGYGLNPERIREIAQDGTSLFISVDCGIRDVDGVRAAVESGADFIIVDHHQPPEGDLPPATAIVNPHQPACEFEFKDMCAAGLAFYLVLALRAELRKRGRFADVDEPDVRTLLDIVAIGTIADVVPLRGLNRILVKAGLSRMAHSPHPGVRALTALATQGRPLTAGSVAFQMGPRLNAAGRISDPLKGFEVLATDDVEIAQGIVTVIDEENRSRQAIQKEIEKQALAQAAEDPATGQAPAYVLWHEEWHPGVTGIVASRVVETYHRPCAMIAVKDGVGKGSIRSIRGFDAVKGLDLCAELLVQYGGHPFAAGLTIESGKLDEFRRAFQKAALELTPPEALTARINVDAEVGFDEIDETLLDAIEKLAPFGAGNPEPKLCTRKARVMSTKRVGADGAHLKLDLTHNGRRIGAIAFRMGDRVPEDGSLVDVAYRPQYNEWRGNVSLQLRVFDLQPSK